MKTLPSSAATRRATSAAYGGSAPAARAPPAAHTHHAPAKDAVPVSTTSTGTGLEPAATVTALTVAEVLEPMWIERISVAPAAACSSYTARTAPGDGAAVDTVAPPVSRS